MKKRVLICLIASMAVMYNLSAKDKDPVLMEVGGDKVTLSEFEYLYHKNSQQQIEKEPLDKYVDRFVVYKLKVADAKAAGIDTTKSFVKEYTMYRNELARPYLIDSTAIDRLALETYERMKREVDVAHIMLPTGDWAIREKSRQKLDSLKQCIENGQDFAELAKAYSIDRSARVNGGDMGYLTVGRTPYSFEHAAFTTPVGQMTIVQTDYGMHLIKVLDNRPSQGEVCVEHILKMFPRNANDSIMNVLTAEMDSIYDLVVNNGGNFEEIAKIESDDRGSAQSGGLLPWFGAGRMVPEFEKVAFELKKGEISKPFKSRYGIHIVKKLDNRSIGSFEDNLDNIMGMIKMDERAAIPQKERIAQLKKEYGLKENSKFLELVGAEVEKYGGVYDSVLIERLQKIDCEAFSFADKKVNSKEVTAMLNHSVKLNPDAIVKYVENLMHSKEDKMIVAYELENLPVKYPDYRNLLNEYYDGMLLFEISNRNVWDKANKDREGLEAYFQAHKDNYKWSEPRFKGYLIYASNDSVLNAVENAIDTLGSDTLFVSLRKQFKGNIRIEYQLAKKGENAVVDEIAFGGKKAENPGRFPVYFAYDYKVIEQPEEAIDVKGLVTSDYQSQLEEQWVAQLRNKYKVKINKKVLKQVQ